MELQSPRQLQLLVLTEVQGPAAFPRESLSQRLPAAEGAMRCLQPAGLGVTGRGARRLRARFSPQPRRRGCQVVGGWAKEGRREGRVRPRPGCDLAASAPLCFSAFESEGPPVAAG